MKTPVTQRGAAAASAAAAEAPRRCEPPDLAGSPWAAHCQLLRRVCVDEGTLVFYDERYQEAEGRQAAPLPALHVDPSKVYTFPWLGAQPGVGAAEGAAGDNPGERKAEKAAGDGAGERGPSGVQQLAGRARRLAFQAGKPGKRRRLEPLPTRPASSREAAAYLAAPAFSACTVPIVVYPLFADNFVHLFHDLASFLHALLRRTPWRAHAKLVTVTPEGLAMAAPEAQLLPPLTQLSVQTWADFSRRLPPDYDPAASGWDGRSARPSYEGGQQRCFHSLFVCGRRFRALRALDEPLPPDPAGEAAALRRAVPRENYAYGQALVAHVQRQQAAEQAARGAAWQLAAAANSSGGTAAAHDGHTLRVVFIRRGGEGRQLLNAAELLEQCNAWRYRPSGGGAALAAECRQVEVPSLAAGVAAAQAADVIVGVHGANMANAWLMRPGSSAVEVSPHQFSLRPGSFGLCNANAQDPSSRVLWWLAVACDPALSQPGPEEAAGTGKPEWWPRDRNTRLPWPALDIILREVATLGGNRQRYIDAHYRSSLHRFNVGAEGVLSRGNGPGGEHGACAAPKPPLP